MFFHEVAMHDATREFNGRRWRQERSVGAYKRLSESGCARHEPAAIRRATDLFSGNSGRQEWSSMVERVRAGARNGHFCT